MTTSQRQGVIVRPRLDSDLPALVELMAAQQQATRYPLEWPLPIPTRDFIARQNERGAWVAEVDGQLAGHVSVTDVVDDEQHAVWSRSTGRPNSELGCVSVLFVGPDALGTGVGGRLLDTAIAFVRAAGHTAVLDVTTQDTNPAAKVYEHRGWRLVGRARPFWLPDSEADVKFFVLPDDVGQITVTGTVAQGHGIASGRSAQNPYPAGSLALQQPLFAERGFDLSGLSAGTINLAIDEVAAASVVRPSITLTSVAWTDLHPPETFSFVSCRAGFGDRQYGGHVYWPHPETKPAHFQAGNVLELLMPRVEGLQYGDRLSLTVPSRAVQLQRMH